MRRGFARLVVLGHGGNAFGAAAETMLQGGIDLAPQGVIVGTQAGDFDEQFADQRVQCRHVGGQWCVRSKGGGVHACWNSAPAAAQQGVSWA